MVVKSEILNDFLRFFSVLVAKLAAGSAVNLALKVKRDMIRENLDLGPKINAMMRDFLESPSQWKELSKETSSKILPSRDRSCRKTLKQIASLIAKVKLNKHMRVLSLFATSRSSESTSFRKSLRCWFGSSDRSSWDEHPFCTIRMVSDRRGAALFPSGSSMVFR
ncbi:hypothetical protein Tco_0331435 [Tanacetum coccineum]